MVRNSILVFLALGIACSIAIGQTVTRSNNVIVMSGDGAVTSNTTTLTIRGVKIPAPQNNRSYALQPASGSTSTTKLWSHHAHVGEGHGTDYVNITLDSVGLKLTTNATDTSAVVILYY